MRTWQSSELSATSAFAEFSSLGTSCFSFANVVDAINDRILDKFPGELKVFQSVDKAIIEEGACNGSVPDRLVYEKQAWGWLEDCWIAVDSLKELFYVRQII